MSERVEERPAYEALRRELRTIELTASIGATLAWDQETMMPPAATPIRAEQMAYLGQLAHERRTSAIFGELLAAAEAEAQASARAEPEGPVRASLREIRRDFDRAVKLPTSLVRALAETTTHAQHVWKEARERNDFASFAPWLEKIIDLTRSRSECLATPETEDPYDPLLDQYEPGARTRAIVAIFDDLRARLTPLLHEVAHSGRDLPDRVHRIALPIERQVAFNQRTATEIGFDFAAGRLDTSAHPFCQGIAPGDTRLTTRYREEGFFDALSSTLHEAGHGLYEQGLPKERHFGEPLGEAISLGIHESQSRMWENFVGRSRPFWEWALPRAQQEFRPALDGIGVEEVYQAMNRVEPNLIRVESDEATYNLHIILRFDLERAMLSGALPIRELPGVWNERMRTDLGLEVPDDRRGCLQDVHWSMAAIGYFPTYTLGNLYAALFWQQIRSAIPDLDEKLASGRFEALLHWLRTEIHQYGRRYTAPELCRRITGREVSAEPFIDYLEAKVRPLYSL